MTSSWWRFFHPRSDGTYGIQAPAAPGDNLNRFGWSGPAPDDSSKNTSYESVTAVRSVVPIKVVRDR